MSDIPCNQIPGEQIDRRAALRTLQRLDPEERLDRYILIPIERTGGTIVTSDVFLQRLRHAPCLDLVCLQIDEFHLLADDPGRHRIDVESLDVAADAIGLDQGRSSPHEGIHDPQRAQIIRSVEHVTERAIPELRKDKSPEQRARSPREPFVHANDRPIVLLDLFLTQCQSCNERDVKARFDRHSIMPARRYSRTGQPGVDRETSSGGLAVRRKKVWQIKLLWGAREGMLDQGV